MSDFPMTIDGRSAGASSSRGVINPATGDVFAQVPDCSREQLDEAMKAAARSRRSASPKAESARG